MEGYKPPREDLNAPDLYIPGRFHVFNIPSLGFAVARKSVGKVKFGVQGHKLKAGVCDFGRFEVGFVDFHNRLDATLQKLWKEITCETETFNFYFVDLMAYNPINHILTSHYPSPTPVMSFVTYILVVGIQLGLEAGPNKLVDPLTKKPRGFTPDVLGLTGSTAFVILCFEVLFIKLGCYLLSVTNDAGFLELIGYCGYQFIG